MADVKAPTAGSKRPSLYTLFTLLCAAFIIYLILYPLGIMLSEVFSPEGLAAAGSLITQPWFVTAFTNTAIVVGVSTVFAVMIGAMLAWLNERTDAQLGSIGAMMPIIPLLIPNVAMSIGWVFIAAPKVGFLNGLLAQLPDWMSFQVNIYSWGGMILLYTINAVPYVYLIVASALRNLDPALEEASLISGAGLFRTFRRISVHAVRVALLSSTLLCIITNVGVYSIPAVIGTTAKIDVLTTRIVFLLNGEFPPKVQEAQLLGIGMLIAVGALWYIQTRSLSKANFATVGGRATGGGRIEMGRWKWPARSFTIGYIAATSVLPILALLVVSLQPFWTAYINFSVLNLGNYVEVLHVNELAVSSLVNSLGFSSIGAVAAMVIAVAVALYTVGRATMASRFVDGTIKSSAAIPHLLMGVAFLIAFSGPPFKLAGTATILILAFIVMYIPQGSIAATAAVSQIGRDLREASLINGANEGRTVREIVVPLAMPGFVAGLAIVFVHMMGDLSAAALLAGIRNPVVGFAILTIWEAGTFGVLAAFAMMLCIVNIVVVSSMFGLGRMIRKR